MFKRYRKSLALRLGALYALLFSVAAVVVFFVLYLFLADALDKRSRAEVELRAEDYALVYQQGGAAALRVKIASEERAPEGISLLVRIIGEGGDTLFARVPPDWVETQVQRIPIPTAFGGTVQVQQLVQTVRIPRNAEKDFTVVNRPLFDGRTLQVARSTDNRAKLLAPLRATFLGVGAGSLALTALGGGLLAWRVTRPLREVNETTQKIVATGDLAARVPQPSQGGELSDLVQQLNLLLSKNAALIAAQRETLDNLAHDLRTPLTRLRGTAELAIQKQGDPKASQEALADCIEESDRVLRLLEAMLDVTAAETGSMPLKQDQVTLSHLLQDTVDLYREVAEEKNIQVTLEPCVEPVQVKADALRLGQAMANLLDNALKYTPAGGTVALRILKQDQQARIEIDDSGPGVPESERGKVWRRLYRLDSSRSQRGLGLGLSLVKAIVEAHHGRAEIENSPTGGARFVITLPV